MTDERENIQQDSNKKLPIWAWVLLIFLGLSILGNIVGKKEPSYSRSSQATNPVDRLPSQIQNTMTEQEKQQYNSDPDSAGFSQSDREFFEEQGVSEAEARAMETILRENGLGN